uniref:Tyrosine-protein phosphatase domain-containing protein n=1 Tax=Caenorhabditis japonica TaxID=281687 RepID=A0A8R1DMK7_CAEJA
MGAKVSQETEQLNDLSPEPSDSFDEHDEQKMKQALNTNQSSVPSVPSVATLSSSLSSLSSVSDHSLHNGSEDNRREQSGRDTDLATLSTSQSEFEEDKNESRIPEQYRRKSKREIRQALEDKGINWKKPTFEDVDKAENVDEYDYMVKRIENPAKHVARKLGLKNEIYKTFEGTEGLENIAEYYGASPELKIIEESLDDLNCKTPYVPTIEDYRAAKHTSGQKVLGKYEILEINNIEADNTVQVLCDGPQGHRIEDFWCECVDQKAGLVVMNGRFQDKFGALCHRYIPLDDNKEDYKCGDIILMRLTDVEVRHEQFRIQKFALRFAFLEESDGWYMIWHVQRNAQDEEGKDYTQEHAQFNEIKNELLKNVGRNVYLEHGPMPYSSPGYGRVMRNVRKPTLQEKIESFSRI